MVIDLIKVTRDSNSLKVINFRMYLQKKQNQNFYLHQEVMKVKASFKILRIISSFER